MLLFVRHKFNINTIWKRGLGGVDISFRKVFLYTRAHSRSRPLRIESTEARATKPPDALQQTAVDADSALQCASSTNYSAVACTHVAEMEK